MREATVAVKLIDGRIKLVMQIAGATIGDLAMLSSSLEKLHNDVQKKFEEIMQANNQDGRG